MVTYIHNIEADWRPISARAENCGTDIFRPSQYISVWPYLARPLSAWPRGDWLDQPPCTRSQKGSRSDWPSRAGQGSQGGQERLRCSWWGRVWEDKEASRCETTERKREGERFVRVKGGYFDVKTGFSKKKRTRLTWTVMWPRRPGVTKAQFTGAALLNINTTLHHPASATRGSRETDTSTCNDLGPGQDRKYDSVIVLPCLSDT